MDHPNHKKYLFKIQKNICKTYIQSQQNTDRFPPVTSNRQFSSFSDPFGRFFLAKKACMRRRFLLVVFMTARFQRLAVTFLFFLVGLKGLLSSFRFRRTPRRRPASLARKRPMSTFFWLAGPPRFSTYSIRSIPRLPGSTPELRVSRHPEGNPQ